MSSSVCPATLSNNLNVGFLSEAMKAIYFLICIMITFIQLYTIVPVSLTLTLL